MKTFPLKSLLAVTVCTALIWTIECYDGPRLDNLMGDYLRQLESSKRQAGLYEDGYDDIAG